MNRRNFLAALFALPVAASAPFQRLVATVWKSRTVRPALSLDTINAVVKSHYLPAISDNYFRASSILAYLKQKQEKPVTLHGTEITLPYHYTPGDKL